MYPPSLNTKVEVSLCTNRLESYIAAHVMCCIRAPHHLNATLTLLKRTHAACSREHCHPSPCLPLQLTAQDRHKLPARLKGGTEKVVGQGEMRQMRRRAHLCGTQGVLYIWKVLNVRGYLETDGKVGLGPLMLFNRIFN